MLPQSRKEQGDRLPDRVVELEFVELQVICIGNVLAEVHNSKELLINHQMQLSVRTQLLPVLSTEFVIGICDALSKERLFISKAVETEHFPKGSAGLHSYPQPCHHHLYSAPSVLFIFNSDHLLCLVLCLWD